MKTVITAVARALAAVAAQAHGDVAASAPVVVKKESKAWNIAGDEPCMAHVPPGRTGEIVWTFSRAGEFDFACLIPGHCQAGMRGKIVVRAR